MANNYNFCTSQLLTSTEKFTWTIDNFSKRRQKNGECLESITFNSISPTNGNQLHWKLLLNPNGDLNESEEHVAVYLKRCNCDDYQFVWARAKFYIEVGADDVGTEGGSGASKKQQKNVVELDFKKFGDEDCDMGWDDEDLHDSWGFAEFIRRDELMNEENGLMKGDQLTIGCEVTVEGEMVRGISSSDIQVPECQALEDMSHLFEKSLFTDFTIKCDDGKEFKVHKCILSCRSKYFAAMFGHELVEAQNNCVQIKDIKAKVLEQMLHFIYIGKAPKLEKMALDLLEAADKYGLDRLKILCEQSLARSMANTTVCGLLILANSYSAKNLKDKAIKYIQMNSNEVMESDGWAMLAKKNPELFKQLMKSIMAGSK